MIQTYCDVDSEKLLQTFLDLVRLDSPSGKEELVRDYLIQYLQALGLPSQVDQAGNVIVSVPAEKASTNTTLLMTGHMDVVPPCLGVKPVIEGQGDDRLIRSAGDTVLGADDKSGLAPMLEALTLTLNHQLPRPNLLFLFTTREEVLLSGAKEMDPKLYRHSDFAIALDHTGEQGTIIHEAPTYIKFKITVHGKSVHAGIMPEKGINAIQLLSWALERLSFGRLDENTTSNIGFIKGGKATNIVPDLVWVEGELRGHDDARLEQEMERIQSTLHEVIDGVEGASFEFERQDCFYHYSTDPSEPAVQKVVQAAQSLDLPIHLIRTNGGSDVNIFAHHGVPGIVLSAGYIEPHSLNERVLLRDMVRCTQFLLAIWEQFAHA